MIRHGYLLPEMTYLVSYPRSGANWLRYCIERISARATLGVSPKDPLTPLDRSVEEAVREVLGATLGVDLTQDAIMQHSHRWHESDKTTRVVMIVRNPKECILRDYRGQMPDDDRLRRIISEDSLSVLCNRDGIGDYAGLLEALVQHPADKRHVVYFEDLKLNPRETLRECMQFMNTPDLEPQLEDFMEHIDRHNKVSVVVYNNGVSKSYTRGTNAISHHSDEFLSIEDKIKWDEYIKENHPTIVPLVERYFEPETSDG